MPQSDLNLDIFGRGDRGTRYRLIACEVAYRECCFAAAVSRNVIDLNFLTQGLHDLESKTMSARVQEAVDQTQADRYQAVLLGFGLCNLGLVGVTARDVPLVIPRAHDCITLFLGSKEAYQAHFNTHKGTFYLTTGWVERDRDNLEDTIEHEDNTLKKMGLDHTLEQYIELYGEETAKMIMSTLTGLEHYRAMCHIEMGVAPGAEERVITQGRAEAEKRGWDYLTEPGRMDIFHKMVNGEWDEETFLIVPPGHTIQQAYDDRIMQATKTL